jgi:hypothetical protein
METVLRVKQDSPSNKLRAMPDTGSASSMWAIIAAIVSLVTSSSLPSPSL